MPLERIAIQIKRLEHAKDLPLPSYASAGSSGMDLRAAVREEITLQPGDIKLIPTGMVLAVPAGFEAQIRPRSGLALKHGVGMVNAPGTVDSDYRGEVGIILINWGPESFTIKRGDRIAQMIIARVYQAELMEAERLDETQRGPGGFGHSGLQ
jgi:dUTP pyrophosphatase